MKSNTETPSASDRRVRVIITRHHAAVLAPAVPLLQPLLESHRHAFAAGGPTGYRHVETVEALYTFDHRGRLVFPAGLLPRVSQALREAGYVVRVDDQRRRGRRWRPAEDIYAAATTAERALLQAVCREPLGQIEVRTRQDRIAKCLLLLRAFPKARVAVAVATRAQALELWRELEEQLDEPIGLELSGVTRRGQRCQVGTFANLSRYSVGGWDLVLLPYAEGSTGERAIELVTQAHSRRVYAFVQPQRRPDRLLQLRLEEMAGKVLFRSAKPRVPVRVVLVPCPPCAVAASTTALERKRAAYWHNQVRNRQVAAVATAAAAKDLVALRRFGLSVRDLHALVREEAPRAVIVVELPEHGRELRALLAGARLLHQVPQTAPAAPATRTGKGGRDRPTIVTAVHAATKRIQADVVLRATGTAWPLRVRGFPPRCEDQDGQAVVLIDLHDAFDAQAKADTRRRIEDYWQHGWHLATVLTSGRGR
jgi:hypothetical protein